MARCGHCGTTIFFGGIRENHRRFCNAKCRQGFYLASVADLVPVETIHKQVAVVHQGPCPKCGGRGPVDMHNNYRVWSVLVLTSWSNKPQLCCRACATRSQAVSALFSALFGWWGFPWGIVLTPIMVSRNIIGICGGPKPRSPSVNLEKFVKFNLAAQLIQRDQLHRPPPLQ